MTKPRMKTSALFPGIGPVTEKRLLEVGVTDVAGLRKLGAVQAYQRLKFRYGKAVTLNALYGLEAVILGCHWQAIPAQRKQDLQAASRASSRTTKPITSDGDDRPRAGPGPARGSSAARR